MRLRTINSKVGLNLLLTILCFLFSIVFFEYYTAGDQLFYRNYYQNVSAYNWLEAFQYYSNALGSIEPGYFFITYLLSDIIEKDLFNSLANSFLLFLLVRQLMIMKVKVFIIILLLLNFYLLVIMFSAERLKFSLLFFLLAYQVPLYIRNVFISISVLTHLQAVVLVIVTRMREVFTALSILLAGRVSILHANLILILIVGFVGVYFFQSHITYKFQVYNSSFGGWAAVLKPFIFFLLAVYKARNKPIITLEFSVLLVAAFFVGAERITILSYFVFMYYALQDKGGVNFWVLVTSIYFSVKGVIFLYSAYVFGDGFVVNVPYWLIL